MSDLNKKTLTPKLRFPEFRDAAGWNCRAGNELFDSITNRAANLELPVLAVTQEHGAIPRDQIDYHVSVTSESIATYKEVCIGDFIISLRSFQGGIEYSRHHGICSPAYIVLRRKVEGSDDYFRYLFKTDRFIQQITRNIEGLRDGKMITYKQFSEQRLPYTVPAEQQKIAGCLMSLDELIAAHTRKLEVLRSQKTGLMQQLFPREGEAVPRIRFPQFCDEWRPEGLDNISNNISSGKDQIDPQGAFELYGSTGTIGKTASGTYTGKFLLIARVGANAGKVRVAIGKFGVTDNTIVISLKNQSQTDFVFYYLDNLALNKLVFGSGQPLITGGQIKAISLRMPNELEQETITGCLSAVDGLITAQIQNLAGLATHKRGLMQQLFPVQEDGL